jgi:hypothetical protein
MPCRIPLSPGMAYGHHSNVDHPDEWLIEYQPYTMPCASSTSVIIPLSKRERY